MDIKKRLPVVAAVGSVLAGAGSVSAYTATYATTDIDDVIINMIASLIAGVDTQALVIGAAIGIVIVVSLYFGLVNKVRSFLKGLKKMAS